MSFFCRQLFATAFLFFSYQFCFAQFQIDKVINKEKIKYTNLKSNHAPAIDLKYYRLDLEVDPEIKFISGAITSYFNSLDSNLNEVSFDLSDNLIVDSIKQRSNKLSFKHANYQLQISLANSLNLGTLDSLTIYYHGVPTTQGLGTFVQASYNDIDSVIYTLSQPYGAREWLPCKDNLYDKVDSVDLNISTPIKNQVASNGLLTKVDTVGSMATYHWKSRYPIVTYLIAFAVTNYEIYEEKLALRSDSLLMQHFQYPGDLTGITNSLTATGTFMTFFDSLFGPYPFMKEKYGHASCPLGGGMEHQTMSFMGNYGGELMAHELAHQWFGNKITCASWQELWLNEGFATYLTALTYEFEAVHTRDPWLQRYLSILQGASFSNPNGSVFKTDTTNVDSLFDNIAYTKGAYLLHMLRYNIGDSLFFKALYNYTNDSSYAYSFVTTNDLKKHLKRLSSFDFEEFFKDWYKGKGYPIYEINWTQQVNTLNLKIEQYQSNPSVYFFDTKIPLRIYYGNQDTTLHIKPRYSGDEFTIDFSHRIDSIVFDPDRWILAKADIISSNQEYFSNQDITIYPNPASEELNIDLNGSFHVRSIAIVDLNGKTVKNFQAYQKSISILDLKSASYFLKIEFDQGFIYKKIIKQ